ncbi:MAG TPA: calcium-binding protein [Solirubrobacteraceae bacterium]|nr:calcium-binding protein [Solirubrobacteraceae bacterium]
MTSRTERTRRRALSLAVITAACLTALPALGAGNALASYSGAVQDGTLQLKGDSASDKLLVIVDPGDPSRLLADVGEDGTTDLTFDRSTFTAIAIDAGPGDDEVRIDRSVTEQVTVDGGPGDDTLLGGAGADTLLGGPGDDFVDGNGGNDTALLGPGADRFQWDPGDGSDVVDGQSGRDVLQFNGSNAGEQIDITANGPRVLLHRDVANITMDLDGIDDVAVNALGGADTIAVGDVSGTDVDTADVSLAGFDGSGDGAADTVIATGSDGPDRADVGSSDGKVVVNGLSAQVNVAGGEIGDHVDVATLGGDDTIGSGVGFTGPATVIAEGGDGTDTATYDGSAGDDAIGIAADNGNVATFTAGGAAFETNAVESLDVSGLAGNDTITGQNGIAALTRLTLDGGAGDDVLRGGDGDDLLLGGAGDDVVDGNRGNDVGQLGAGADSFQWDPGDGSDVVEGQGGKDTLVFNGSNAGEDIDVSANGPRVRLFRNIGSVTMDFDGVEGLALAALGGPDTITIGDLSGTDLDTADVNLAGFDGTGDGAADSVTVNGTNRADTVNVTRSGAQVLTTGLAAQTRIAGSEPAADSLHVNTLDGRDRVTVAPDVADLITSIVDLGGQ